MEEQNTTSFEEQKDQESQIDKKQTIVSQKTGKKPFPKMIVAIISVAVIAVTVLLILLLGGGKDGNVVCEFCGASISEAVKFCPNCGLQVPDAPTIEDKNKEEKYNLALDLINKCQYTEAYQILKQLGDYKDAKEKLNKFVYVPTRCTHSVQDLNGSVKYVGLVATVSYDANDLPTQAKHAYHATYEELGFKHIYDCSYDSNGKIVKEVFESQNGNMINEYTYDTGGALIKKIHTQDDSVTIYEYEYDTKARLIKEIRSYPDSSTKSTTSYTYDTAGTLVKKVVSSYDYLYIYTYDYDANGNMIKEVHSSSNQITYTYNATYDSNNNLIQKLTSYSNGTSSTDYTYDNSGNLVKEISTSLDGTTHTTDYTYDNSGNLVKKIITSPSGSISTCDYTYDNNGNLIKEIHTTNSNVSLIRIYDTEGNLITLEQFNYYSSQGGADYKQVFSVEFKLTYLSFDMSAEDYKNHVYNMLGLDAIV